MGSVVDDLRVSDPRLARVWEKVRGGERLDVDDGLACLETEDLLGLGRMADHVKRQKSGDWVYFVINRYVNPTNVCVLSCSFCDFAKKKGEEGAFEHSIEDIVGMIEADVREVHIVGGHHPDWPFEYYERLVQAIHATRPDAQIKAFTAAEIDYLWRRWKIEPQEALEPPEGRRAPHHARRRRGDLLRPAAEGPPLHGQGGSGPLARDPPDRPRPRHPLQCDDAVRPHRDVRRAHRSTCCASGSSRTRPAAS